MGIRYFTSRELTYLIKILLQFSEKYLLIIMHMTYYFGILNEAVVVPFWKPSNEMQTFATCLMAIALVFVLQLIKIIRINYLDPKFTSSDNYTSCLFNVTHLLNSILLFFQQFLSYTLMLAAMLYNMWLLMSICFGFVLAHWLTANAMVKSTEKDGAARPVVNAVTDMEECC